MRLPQRLVLVFPEYRDAGRRLAEAAGCPWAEVEIHRFPDGESRVRLPEAIPQEAIFCRSLDDPNTKLVELMLSAHTARRCGARRLTLVAPYLCYMRQDAAFRPGEAISQTIVGAELASWFDEVVTVDPHLHRIDDLAAAVPAGRSVALSAAASIAGFLAARSSQSMLVGPDAESEQWVSRLAALCGLDSMVARKRRLGDRRVELELPDRDLEGRSVVVVDDVASTGHTLLAALAAVRKRRVGRVSVMVTHALFTNDVTDRLTEAGAEDIWSTDSVPHPTNVVELAPLLASGLSAAG